MAWQFFGEIVRQAKQRGLMSSEHFSVDGTMVEAWASQKSFRPKQEKSDEDEPKGWDGDTFCVTVRNRTSRMRTSRKGAAAIAKWTSEGSSDRMRRMSRRRTRSRGGGGRVRRRRRG